MVHTEQIPEYEQLRKSDPSYSQLWDDPAFPPTEYFWLDEITAIDGKTMPNMFALLDDAVKRNILKRYTMTYGIFYYVPGGKGIKLSEDETRLEMVDKIVDKAASADKESLGSMSTTQDSKKEGKVSLLTRMKSSRIGQKLHRMRR